MTSSVEEQAWGRIVTDSPQFRRVSVSLRYDAADPLAVRFAFPSGLEWTFPRELLESGIRSPARRGDVGVWPCGRVQAVLEFHSSQGVAVVQFDAKSLVRFLRHTYAVGTTPAASGSAAVLTEPEAQPAPAATPARPSGRPERGASQAPASRGDAVTAPATGR